MNRSFRLVWSLVRSCWLVAPESARASGGPSLGGSVRRGVTPALISTLWYSFSAVSTASAQAPAGLVDPVLRAGNATIDLSNAQRAVVHQSSQKAVIDWRRFDVAKDTSIQFVQPNASAIALNRVTGAQASRIDGSILANGQVWLLNPNGVLIGKSGRINTHGFLASTLGLSTDNFMQGNYTFQADPAGFGSVVNEGEIISAQAGYAVLAGRQVSNQGLVQAQMGQVVLASGKAATLDLVGDGLLRFAVTAPLDDMPADGESLINNTGRLSAAGGRVLITAQSATDIVRQVVNVQGVVEATSLREVNGEIVLEGGPSGTVAVSGELNASGTAAGEKGGAVKVFGQRLHLQDGAVVNATGDSGGGDIYVGGGWQGALVDGRPSALEVRVDAGASLDASALANGNGGTVVAWSDVGDRASKTYALGSFKARGGPQGGDGGRIETSGYWLGVDSIQVNAGAGKGKAGLWLLDPADIYIGTASGDTYRTVIDPVALGGVLGTTNVTLSAADYLTVTSYCQPLERCSNNFSADPKPVTGTGSIYVTSGLSWTSTNKLTLQAAGRAAGDGLLAAPGNIEISALISAPSGSLSLVAGNTGVAGAVSSTSLGTITIGGELTIDQPGNSVLDGAISGNGSLVKSGPGTLTLSGANTHSGQTSVLSGSLVIGNLDALKSSALYLNTDTSLSFSIPNLATTDEVNVRGLLGIGRVDLTNEPSGSAGPSGVTLRVIQDTPTAENQFAAYGGQITGLGGLVKDGVGNFSLFGSNSYAGGTRAVKGVLATSSASGFGTGPLTIDSGAKIQVALLSSMDSFPISAISGSGTFESFNPVDIGAGDTNSNFEGTLKLGFMGLTKLGSGTLSLRQLPVLYSDSFFAPTVYVLDGTLKLLANDSESQDSVIEVRGGTLDLNGFSMGSRRFLKLSDSGGGAVQAPTFGALTNSSLEPASVGGYVALVGHTTLTTDGPLNLKNIDGERLAAQPLDVSVQDAGSPASAGASMSPARLRVQTGSSGETFAPNDRVYVAVCESGDSKTCSMSTYFVATGRPALIQAVNGDEVTLDRPLSLELEKGQSLGLLKLEERFNLHLASRPDLDAQKTVEFNIASNIQAGTFSTAERVRLRLSNTSPTYSQLVTTDGAQTYKGPVIVDNASRLLAGCTLANPCALDSDGFHPNATYLRTVAGDIVFEGTISSAADQSFSSTSNRSVLFLESGAGQSDDQTLASLSYTHDVVFKADVGNTFALGGLFIGAKNIRISPTTPSGIGIRVSDPSAAPLLSIGLIGDLVLERDLSIETGGGNFALLGSIESPSGKAFEADLRVSTSDVPSGEFLWSGSAGSSEKPLGSFKLLASSFSRKTIECLLENQSKCAFIAGDALIYSSTPIFLAVGMKNAAVLKDVFAVDAAAEAARLAAEEAARIAAEAAAAEAARLAAEAAARIAAAAVAAAGIPMPVVAPAITSAAIVPPPTAPSPLASVAPAASSVPAQTSAPAPATATIPAEAPAPAPADETTTAGSNAPAPVAESSPAAPAAAPTAASASGPAASASPAAPGPAAAVAAPGAAAPLAAVAPPPPSPVPQQKPPTPVDVADTGDRALASVAPPQAPPPAAQPQRVAVRTVQIAPGSMVAAQVPSPPRPPAGAGLPARLPSVGNSARW